MPMIHFVAELARHNQSARQAALEGGLLDMLLRIYVVFPMFYMSNTERQTGQSALLDVGESALVFLSADTLRADAVYNRR
jgi:hypothetical protein